MSRWARLAALLVPAVGLTSPAAAQGPPAQLSPLAIQSTALDLQLQALPIDLPTSSLDNSVSFHSSGVVLQADVLFAFNSARLAAAAHPRIAQALTTIRRRRPRALRIQGYTDAIGTASYNLGLSRRRAQAVQRALVQQLGAGAPPMRAIGYGEADPVAANTNPDGTDAPRGRALNRRVEIHFVG